MAGMQSRSCRLFQARALPCKPACREPAWTQPWCCWQDALSFICSPAAILAPIFFVQAGRTGMPVLSCRACLPLSTFYTGHAQHCGRHEPDHHSGPLHGLYCSHDWAPAQKSATKKLENPAYEYDSQVFSRCFRSTLFLHITICCPGSQ
jgi:hypothetical protein